VLRRIMAQVRNEVSEILDRTTLADALRAPTHALIDSLDEGPNAGPM